MVCYGLKGYFGTDRNTKKPPPFEKLDFLHGFSNGTSWDKLNEVGREKATLINQHVFQRGACPKRDIAGQIK
jgi:hypothetical protein